MKIIPSQVVISCYSLYFHHIFKAVYNRYVQSSSSKIKDQKQLLFPVIQIRGQSRRTGFVNQSVDLYPGQQPCLFRSVPLFIMEISRNRNDHLFNLFSQISLGILYNGADYKAGQFFRGKVKASQMKSLLFTHISFKRADGSVRSRNQPLPGNLSYNDLLIFVHAHHAWRKVGTIAVWDQLDPSVLIYAAQRIRGSQVNA